MGDFMGERQPTCLFDCNNSLILLGAAGQD
jgi:hypothetical protein